MRDAHEAELLVVAFDDALEDLPDPGDAPATRRMAPF